MQSLTKMEVACELRFSSLPLHPFAFRVHTHALGVAVSGWRVRRGKNNDDLWTLLGKEDPQLPQMFYPVQDYGVELKEGDTLAAR